MKTKELATDELLKMATPRPWTHAEGYKDEQYRTIDVHGVHIGIAGGKTLCGYAVAKIRFDQVQEEQAEANAEILCRALSSFEAMREALKKTLAIVRLQNGNLYEDINEIQKEADNALALAEGKAVQSSLDAIEINHVLKRSEVQS